MNTLPWSHKTILTVVCLACLFFGLRNYHALLNADQYAYLCFAKALSRGSLYQEYLPYRLFADRVPPGVTVNLQYGTRNFRDGKVYSGLPIGFPLLLALALRAGGLPAVFGVNICMLVMFVVAFYLALREIFRLHPAGPPIALLGIFFLLTVDEMIFPRYSIILMRDLSSITFFWIGLWGVLVACGEGTRGKLLYLTGGAVSLAFSCVIRLTNAVSCLPVAVYVLFSLRSLFPSKRKALIVGLVAAGLFLLTVSPEFIENYRFNKNPFASLRHLIARSPGFFSSTGSGLFSMKYFAVHFPSNLRLLSSVFGLPGLLFLLFGVISFRRRREVWFLLLPIPLLHLLLFSVFEEDFRRYLVPVYPFLIGLVSAGVVGFLRGWEKLVNAAEEKRRFPGWILQGAGAVLLAVGFWMAVPPAGGFDWLICLTLAAGAWCLFPAPRRPLGPARLGSVWLLTILFGATVVVRLGRAAWEGKHFGLSEVNVLRREIEQVVPPDSVVFGTRYLIQNVDFYTHAWALDPQHLHEPFSLSLKEGVERLFRAGLPVFIFDNKGVKSGASSVQQIGQDFDLEKVRTWKSADLSLARENYSGSEYLNLYRVLPWDIREAVVDLPTPESVDYLVALDFKNAPAFSRQTEEIEISVSGQTMPSPNRPGLNFVFLPARLVETPLTKMKVVSGEPISRRLLLDCRPALPGYQLEFGKGRKFPDNLFLEEGFGPGASSSYRRLYGAGSIRIPRYRVEGHEAVLVFKVRNDTIPAAPATLRLALEGTELAVFNLAVVGEWQVIECRLPDEGPGGSTPLLKLTATVPPPSAGGESGGNQGAIAFRWIGVEQRPRPQNSNQ